MGMRTTIAQNPEEAGRMPAVAGSARQTPGSGSQRETRIGEGSALIQKTSATTTRPSSKVTVKGSIGETSEPNRTGITSVCPITAWMIGSMGVMPDGTIVARGLELAHPARPIAMKNTSTVAVARRKRAQSNGQEGKPRTLRIMDGMGMSMSGRGTGKRASGGKRRLKTTDDAPPEPSGLRKRSNRPTLPP